MTRLLGTRRDRRAALVGSVVVGGTLLLGRGLPALDRLESDWRARGESAALSLMSSARELDRSSREERDPRSRLDALRLDESVLSGATPTAAAAEALAYLTGLTQVLGASLLSARPESDSVFLDGVASITVHLALTTNAEGIRKLLEYVETGPKLFRVRSLAVTQPAPAAAAPLDEALRVDLSVESVARRVGDGESR